MTTDCWTPALRSSDPTGVRWGLRARVSHKHSGDAGVNGPRTTL